MSRGYWRDCEKKAADGLIDVKLQSNRDVGFKLRIGDEVAKRQPAGRPSMIDRGVVEEGYVTAGVTPEVVWYAVRRQDERIFKAGEDELEKL